MHVEFCTKICIKSNGHKKSKKSTHDQGRKEYSTKMCIKNQRVKNSIKMFEVQNFTSNSYNKLTIYLIYCSLTKCEN